ncbi:SDR family oxidoreductase [Rhodovulum viride]|uniref:SDR family oxidoreductase n=1 Tax=Rhodovulum viride TaxID=1231134 RepID=UPI001FE29173|nr:SDR family oxidoreductase [Rhodovulum viride]
MALSPVLASLPLAPGGLPICGVAHTSTKGAIDTMTKNIAIRLSNTKIRCDAIAPGVTETDAVRAWAAGEQEGGGELPEFSDKCTNTTVPSTEPVDQRFHAPRGHDHGPAFRQHELGDFAPETGRTTGDEPNGRCCHDLSFPCGEVSAQRHGEPVQPSSSRARGQAMLRRRNPSPAAP